MKKNELLLSLALALVTAVGGAMIAASPASAISKTAAMCPCSNTKCNGVTQCNFAPGMQCEIAPTGDECNTSLCDPC